MTDKKRRGFLVLREKNPDLQKEIASRGGKAAHAAKRAHQFTPEEGRDAGRKGGMTVSRDREHMAEIGRKGAESRRQNKLASANAKPPLDDSPEAVFQRSQQAGA